MEISVSIEKDADGYLGRECPTCEKYFKLKPETGVPSLTQTRCPYCNRRRQTRRRHIGKRQSYDESRM